VGNGAEVRNEQGPHHNLLNMKEKKRDTKDLLDIGGGIMQGLAVSRLPGGEVQKSYGIQPRLEWQRREGRYVHTSGMANKGEGLEGERTAGLIRWA